jgi:hypothetical protein
MKVFVVILSIFTLCEAKCVKCPPNEVYTECGASCQPGCNSLYEPVACTFDCRQGCVCAEDYVRDISGSCIPISECCGKNEKYSTCATPLSCQESCEEDTGIVCPMVCITGCICEDGFLRLSPKNSTCVAQNQCPK